MEPAKRKTIIQLVSIAVIILLFGLFLIRIVNYFN